MPRTKKQPEAPRELLPLRLELQPVLAYAFRVDDPSWSGTAFIGLSSEDALGNARRAVTQRYKGEAIPSLILGGVCIMCHDYNSTPHEHGV